MFLKPGKSQPVLHVGPPWVLCYGSLGSLCVDMCSVATVGAEKGRACFVRSHGGPQVPCSPRDEAKCHSHHLEGNKLEKLQTLI